MLCLKYIHPPACRQNSVQIHFTISFITPGTHLKNYVHWGHLYETPFDLLTLIRKPEHRCNVLNFIIAEKIFKVIKIFRGTQIDLLVIAWWCEWKLVIFNYFLHSNFSPPPHPQVHSSLCHSIWSRAVISRDRAHII